MAQKNITQLTTTLNAAITSQSRRENTADRVRSYEQDIIDSTLNLTSGGAVTGALSASTLFVNGSSITAISIPANQIPYGTGGVGLTSSHNFTLSGDNAFVSLSFESWGDQGFQGYNITKENNEENQSNFFRYHTDFSGNLFGTSIPFGELTEINSRVAGKEGSGAISLRGLPVYILTYDADSGSGNGARFDEFGLRIGDVSTLHNANTNLFEAGILSASNSQILSGGTEISTFFAPVTHTHTIAQVTNLSGSLNTKANLSGATFTGGVSATTLYTNGSLNAATITSSSLISTGDTRIVEASSAGTLSATRLIINAYSLSAGITTLLETPANWNLYGVYTGSTITGTYQGQKHFDDNYFYEAVADNTFIRLIRG